MPIRICGHACINIGYAYVYATQNPIDRADIDPKSGINIRASCEFIATGGSLQLGQIWYPRPPYLDPAFVGVEGYVRIPRRSTQYENSRVVQRPAASYPNLAPDPGSQVDKRTRAPNDVLLISHIERAAKEVVLPAAQDIEFTPCTHPRDQLSDEMVPQSIHT